MGGITATSIFDRVTQQILKNLAQHGRVRDHQAQQFGVLIDFAIFQIETQQLDAFAQDLIDIHLELVQRNSSGLRNSSRPSTKLPAVWVRSMSVST